MMVEDFYEILHELHHLFHVVAWPDENNTSSIISLSSESHVKCTEKEQKGENTTRYLSLEVLKSEIIKAEPIQWNISTHTYIYIYIYIAISLRGLKKERNRNECFIPFFHKIYYSLRYIQILK